MAGDTYRIEVEVESDLAAQQATRSLADQLRETPGVLDVTRRKENLDTMDPGPILEIILTSAATVAVAQGVADWLRRTRGARLTIVKDLHSGSIKAEVQNITADVALRITEKITGK
jgi:TusA-related sulfurtransferase